jgi:DNA-directed RNA polymerase delta subunit
MEKYKDYKDEVDTLLKIILFDFEEKEKEAKNLKNIKNIKQHEEQKHLMEEQKHNIELKELELEHDEIYNEVLSKFSFGNDNYKNKIKSIYNTLNMNNSYVLLGPALSGKTNAITCLRDISVKLNKIDNNKFPIFNYIKIYQNSKEYEEIFVKDDMKVQHQVNNVFFKNMIYLFSNQQYINELEYQYKVMSSARQEIIPRFELKEEKEKEKEIDDLKKETNTEIKEEKKEEKKEEENKEKEENEEEKDNEEKKEESKKDEENKEDENKENEEEKEKDDEMKKEKEEEEKEKKIEKEGEENQKNIFDIDDDDIEEHQNKIEDKKEE